MPIRTDNTKMESSASVQKAQACVRVKEQQAVVSTSNCRNDVGEYGKQVVVRGSVPVNVNIPIDIAREQARYENLTANRGSKTYSTSSED